MLFERLVVHEDCAHDAAMNMAIDEALLEAAGEPTLRFYSWKQPAISLGYFGKFADSAKENGVREFVRRWTGGGSVPHGDDLTYALVTPAKHRAFQLGPRAIYAALHYAIQSALREEGLETELAAAPAPKISDACFANPVRDDLMMQDRKVAGAAQRRTRAGFLQQGSIQVPSLTPAFRDRFSRALAGTVEKRAIPPVVLERAALLARQKYATDDWLRRC